MARITRYSIRIVYRIIELLQETNDIIERMQRDQTTHQ